MTYHTLTAIEDNQRVILFGDYDLAVVRQELADIKYGDYDRIYTSYKITKETK